MKRRSSIVKSQPVRPPAAPRLLESDLAAWVGAGVARVGRRDALLGRVERLRLSSDGTVVDARVRGTRSAPHRVRVWLDEENLVSRCTCDSSTRDSCRHAVAALEALRFPVTVGKREAPQGRVSPSGRAARGSGRVIRRSTGGDGYLVLGEHDRVLPRDERISQARDDELTARRSAASRERATVRRLEAPAPFDFAVQSRKDDTPVTVRLRSADAARASCTCLDYGENELQHCKHIERVRRWLLRNRQPLPAATLSVGWEARVWIDRVVDPLRETRLAAIDCPLPAALNDYFDADGWIRPTPAGESSGTWVTRALGETRRVAHGAGGTFDVDPAVLERVELREATDRRRRRLAQIGKSGAAWRSATAQLSFRLHAYQERGALFLARMSRAFLADDMGLGKTVQAIVAALLLRHVDGAHRTLIVCPASLKHQWRQEIELACGERARVIEGSPARRLKEYEAWREGFLILNYELVLRDLAAIRQMAPDLIVLDEAQRIKNWGTKTARAVKRLESRHAFVLTGTPLENRLIELHSLVEFLHPRGLGPRWRLLPIHAVTEAQGRVVAYEGLDVLRRRLRGFFLRRDRATVLDQLPERTENTFWTGMTPAQLRPYRSQAAAAAALMSRKTPLMPGEVRRLLQALTSMRILCNALAQSDWDSIAPRLADPGPPARAEIRRLASPKLEEFARVLDDLLDEPGIKVVVFSQWVRMLRLANFVVRALFDERQVRAEVFHGGLASKKRGLMLEAFRNDPDFRVLFSTDAGGLGLNLQHAASVVIHLEVPWNPAILEQRIGRVHRIGQKRSVQVLHFVTRGAIEERVRQVVASKRALFDGLLVEGADRVEFDEYQRSSVVQRLTAILGDGNSDEAR